MRDVAGPIDVPVAGGPFERCPFDVRFTSPRETGLAIVLWSLLNQSGQFTTWLNFDRVIQAFVGWTDSLTFAQLGGVLAGAGIRTLADVPDLATLQNLQTNIERGDLGVQNIRSDYFLSPLGPQPATLPQSFTVFGQKFVRTVGHSRKRSTTHPAGAEWHDEQGGTTRPRGLGHGVRDLWQRPGCPRVGRANEWNIPRSGPSACLEAARWQAFPAQFAAARVVMDAQQPGAWDSNIYMSWLACLRELSAPTTGVEFPEAVRTRAWAMKTLNTQLASWTQLRHDTILYAKQSVHPR